MLINFVILLLKRIENVDVSFPGYDFAKYVWLTNSGTKTDNLLHMLSFRHAQVLGGGGPFSGFLSLKILNANLFGAPFWVHPNWCTEINFIFCSGRNHKIDYLIHYIDSL